MSALSRWPIQALFYAAFAAAIGYFSQAPSLRLLPEGEALVRLSLIHAAQLRSPCRERTPEELAKLPPNMRATSECPRERSLLRVEVEMDGTVIHSVTAAPSGLSRDGAATVYRKTTVPAGRHVFRARLADGPDGTFGHQVERTLDLVAGQALLIDYVPAQGGFVFR